VSAPLEPLSGSLIDGRYRVDRAIASGGFATVYAAFHIGLSAPVALKVLDLPEQLGAERLAERIGSFLEEARTLKRLRHPNIVAALDVGLLPDDGSGVRRPYIVMEWCGGPTLKKLLEERRGLPMSPAEAWLIFAPLLAAMEHAHGAGVAHRDLKPANVVLEAAPTGGGGALTPRVVDFGIAKILSPDERAGSGKTRTASRFSPFTPRYAAPEQLARARTGPWTDVHALALIFVEMTTGQPAVDPDRDAARVGIDPVRPTPKALGVDVGALEPVLSCALALRPADRYPDAGALRAAMEAVADAGWPSALDPDRDRGPHAAGPAWADLTAPPSSQTVLSRPRPVPAETFGHFVLEEEAGRGGMGVVYRGTDRESGRPVAVKVLQREGGGAEARRRFEREANALAALDHPGIVRYVAHGSTADGRTYLAMEWIDGEDLEARLGRGPLTVPEALTLGRRLAGALGAVHARDVVHRDLKPSNVLLPGGDLEQAKIADFGVAALPGAVRATQSGVILGTPAYMAPEQARGERGLDARADVFALGCILYECLAGRPAFEGREVMAVLAKIVLDEVPNLRDVPPGVAALVARMLAKDPGARPANGDAVAMALDAVEAELDGSPPPAALTGGEQRLSCIVLAQAPRGGTPGDTAPAALAVIAARGGHPVLLADGTIAVTFPGSLPAADQAALAAGCALALRSALPSWPVAVATGRFGTDAHRPVGEAIERATTRIGARRHGGGPLPIDVDEVTAGLLDHRFEVAAGAAGHELSGERDVPEKARLLLGRPTVFVGRERELLTLEALLAECIEEPAARAVLVTAPAGVGKSRLRYELCARFRARGVETWISRGDPMRAGGAFGLLAPLVRHAAQILDGEPAEARRQRLIARVSRSVAPREQERVAEFLGELVGTPFPDEGRVQLHAARQDPRLLGDQMRRAWVDFVDAETRGRPLAMVLEDLHWGDVPSAEYVDAALRLLRDRPLLVLGLARPEVHDRLPKLWHERAVQEIRLPELSRRACERLARDVLGDGATPEVMGRLWERTGGNAFFLEELMRATAQGQSAAWPETVLAMIEARLDALDGAERRLLRAASVFGEVFWRGGVSALIDDERVDERLRRLMEEEWLTARETSKLQGQTEYVFRHDLVREAVYCTLTGEDRVLGHRVAGAWLEAAGETDPRTLAEHFDRGDDGARAIRWYAAAATHALEGTDLEQAIVLAGRAITRAGDVSDLSQDDPVVAALARAYLVDGEARGWRNDLAGAAASAAEALRHLPRASGPWFLAVADRAVFAARLGRDSDLVAAASDIEALWPEVPLPQHIGSAARIAKALTLNGIYARADSLLALIAEAEPSVADPAVLARIDVACGTRALGMGDLAVQHARMEAAIAHFAEAGDAGEACNCRGYLAFAQMLLGRYEAAVCELRQVLAAAERMGLRYLAVNARHNLGLALARAGALDEAVAMETEAVSVYSAMGDVRLTVWSRTYLAGILVEAGDLPAAEREATAAVEALATLPNLLPFPLAMRANVRLRRGDVPGALPDAELAHTKLRELGAIEEGEALLRLTYAEALEAAGRHEEAVTVIDEARRRLLEWAAKIGDPAMREGFLQAVPENARTLALAEVWTRG
jgi:serine/threonine protein kinase/tetratricopeptide (TPR) repeat protein